MSDRNYNVFVSVGSLWVCIMLNPHSSCPEKQQWRELLSRWTQLDACPREDLDFRALPAPRQDHDVSCHKILNFIFSMTNFALLSL
jgi:hypothetical protein